MFVADGIAVRGQDCGCRERKCVVCCAEEDGGSKGRGKGDGDRRREWAVNGGAGQRKGCSEDSHQRVKVGVVFAAAKKMLLSLLLSCD